MIERPGPTEEAILDRAIDEVLMASFPASDPPLWDSLAARSRTADPATTASSPAPIPRKR